MRFKKRFSRSQINDFKEQMEKIEKFCQVNKIDKSRSSDSYYFTLNDINYRVSNHSVNSSTHHNGKEANTIYIHASKVRIIEIYNNLKKGLKLNGRGQIIS